MTILAWLCFVPVYVFPCMYNELLLKQEYSILRADEQSHT